MILHCVGLLFSGWGYLFTSDSFDRQVDHRIYRLIRVAVNFWGDEGWVTACHHCRVVPDDKDAQSLAKVTHHLVLVLARHPVQKMTKKMCTRSHISDPFL